MSIWRGRLRSRALDTRKRLGHTLSSRGSSCGPDLGSQCSVLAHHFGQEMGLPALQKNGAYRRVDFGGKASGRAKRETGGETHVHLLAVKPGGELRVGFDGRKHSLGERGEATHQFDSLGGKGRGVVYLP